MKKFRYNFSMNKQRGAALLILAVILILTVTLIMAGKHSRNADKSQREADVNKLLADAKEAMLAIAVSNNTLPGVLLYPDRNNDPFDGRDDCHGGPNPQTNPNLLMGRLPFIGNGAGGCAASVPTSLDINQSMNPNEDTRPLHYVISQNLVEYVSSGPPALANTINASVASEGDGWLTVYDSSGNIIGQNVAFIIFYPGAPLAGQNRTPPLANASQYLDSFTVPVIGLVNNANPPAITPAPSNYVAATESATFNDKLIFVTANDLMRRVESAMLNIIANNMAAPYPVALPTATLIAIRPELTNWLSATANTYDNAVDTLFGNTGYPGTSVIYTQGVDCNGTPSAPPSTTARLQGVLQCLTLQ